GFIYPHRLSAPSCCPTTPPGRCSIGQPSVYRHPAWRRLRAGPAEPWLHQLRTLSEFALAVLSLGRLDAMTDPAPARRVGYQPTLLQLRGWVHYHQVYLLEAGSDLSGMLDDGLGSPVGIICGRPGSA